METSNIRKRVPVSALFDPKIVLPAMGSAFVKLNPRTLIKNPVMFILEIVTALTTVILIRDLVTGGQQIGFELQIVLWLWFTVLFANFAEAIAEGRGKAQAAALRRQRTETQAKLLTGPEGRSGHKLVPSTSLKVGDVVLVEAGDTVPSDGEVTEGIASVNEAAITGESAPVIRESGGDRSAVTGGTQVLSDWIKVRITAALGSTFLDRMIKLVEGAERQKTPNEIALNILLVGLTIIFVFATATIPSYVAYAEGTVSVVILVALFVTLIPTTIGALLSAIGIAGMDRLVRFNVLAMSGRAVEAAGDVDTLLLDKTGTITLGNRQATEFKPMRGVTEQELADAAQLASLADETPEGRSIVVLAKEKYRIRGRDLAEIGAQLHSIHSPEPDEWRRGRQLVGAQGRSRFDPQFPQRPGGCGRPLRCRSRIAAGGQHRASTGDQCDCRRHRQLRRHAACGGERRSAARRHSPQGYRQGRHP